MTQQNEHETRRPLKVRDAGFAKRIARWLTDKNIEPNHISLFSVVFAIIAAMCLLIFSTSSNHYWLNFVWPLLAAIAIQGRLLCNLFDGMVAVEGGKSTPSGELFNDIPDRIADPLILVALGLAATQHEFNGSLAWLAGILSVLTAYVRTLSASIGAPISFAGPMAKQHRMAIATIACVLVIIELLVWGSRWSLSLALWVIVIGSIITVTRRTHSAYLYLERPQQQSSHADTEN